MSEQNIYDVLRQGGLSHNGACAVMGNMYAESVLNSRIVQYGYSKLSNDEFTNAVDNGSLDFINDFKGGYGLCQWTYKPRKVNLLSYAEELDVSIGDETMQTQFCLKELKEEYASLYNALLFDGGLNTLTDRVCKEFERPAINNLEQRRNYASMFSKRLGASSTASTVKDASSTARYDGYVKLAQAFLNVMGYQIAEDGIASDKLVVALREFANDVETQLRG